MAAWVPGIYDVGLRLPIKYGLVMTIRIFFFDLVYISSSSKVVISVNLLSYKNFNLLTCSMILQAKVFSNTSFKKHQS